MSIDLNLIRTFVAIYETQSVSGAAKRLSITQPSVSYSLNRLRDLLHDPLFTRSRDGMDAPMSRSTRRLGQIGQNERVQFPDDIALQATMDFLVRHPFLCPALDVSPCPGIAAHAHHGNGPQGIIGGSVTAPVQAVSDRLAR